MQTGLLPHEHGAVAHTHPDDDSFAIPKQYEGSRTLPAMLDAAGYDTYLGSAFITPFLAMQGWFQQHCVYGDADAATVIEEYRSWRENRNQTYGYLQLGDLHAPIEPPEEYVRSRNVDTSLDGLATLEQYTDDYETAPDGWRENRLRLYRAALEYVEDALTPLVEEVRENTLLVVTGDHGEAMWEHHDLDRQFADSRPNYCVGHGGTPFDTLARVPARIHPSRDASLDNGGWPSGRDLPRTICAGLGIDESAFNGANWFTGISEDQATICEGTRYGTERKAIYQRHEKVIRSETDDVTLGATIDETGETFGVVQRDVTRGRLVAVFGRAAKEASN